MNLVMLGSDVRPSERLHANRDALLAVASQMRMSNVRVFGSVAQGSDTDGSDLDLLVDSPPDTTLLDMVELQSRLEAIMGCRVDVLTPDELPSRFRAQVLKEATLL